MKQNFKRQAKGLARGARLFIGRPMPARRRMKNYVSRPWRRAANQAVVPAIRVDRFSAICKFIQRFNFDYLIPVIFFCKIIFQASMTPNIQALSRFSLF